MYQVQFLATDSADWGQAIELIDANTNLPLDLTDATFELEVTGNGCPPWLNASTAEGTIEIVAPGTIRWSFPKTRMTNLTRGKTYSVGLTMTTPGGTTQIFIGTLAILDGIVR